MCVRVHQSVFACVSKATAARQAKTAREEGHSGGVQKCLKQRLKGGWIRIPPGLIERCNDGAVRDARRKVYLLSGRPFKEGCDQTR